MTRQSLRLSAAAVLLVLGLVTAAGAAEQPPLPEGALLRIGAPPLRHPASVINVAFAPDGKTFVATGNPPAGSQDTDKLVILRETATGREVREFRGHTAGVQAVAFAPDGSRLVTGGTDSTLRLWDVATAKELRPFLGHTGPVLAVAYSPDGKLVASASHDLTVRIWDAASGKQVHSLPGHKSEGTSNVVFSPDSKTLASVGADFAIRLWDVATGKEVGQLPGHPSDVESLSFSPDGKRLASAGDDRTVRLWDVATGKEVHRFAGCPQVATTVRFAPSGATLAAGCQDQLIRFWEVETAKLVRTARGHLGTVSEIAFSPDGKVLASAGHEGVVRLWDAATGKPLPQSGGEVLRAALSLDGSRLATAGSDLMVRFWDPATGKELLPALKVPAPVTTLAFAADGKTLATGTIGARVTLWDVASGRQLRQTEPQGGFVLRLAFAPDGKSVFASGLDRVRQWDATTAALTAGSAQLGPAVGNFGPPLTMALSPDGAYLATGSPDGRTHVWDVAGGVEARSPLAGQQAVVTALTYSADGRTLAVAAVDRTLRLWEASTGKERRSLTLPSPARSLALTADGRILAAGCEDGVIRLWDLAAAKELAERRGHHQVVNYLAASADGRLLVSAGTTAVALLQQTQRPFLFGGDTTALVWDLGAVRKELAVPVKPAAAEVERLWTDLTGNDTAKAYTASWRLAAAPELAVPLLKERLPKAGGKEEKADGIDRLVADLDHDEFATREKATQELIRLGAPALSAVREALAKTKSREVRRRAEEVLAVLKGNAGPSPEVLRFGRGVEVLERIRTADARALLETWSRGPAETPLTREARAGLERIGKK